VTIDVDEMYREHWKPPVDPEQIAALAEVVKAAQYALDRWPGSAPLGSVYYRLEDALARIKEAPDA
jgi:hypothetical protein